MDKFINFVFNKIGELIAVGVWAGMSTAILTFSEWNPFLIFVVLFVSGFVILQILNLFRKKTDDKLIQAIEAVRAKENTGSLIDDFSMAKVAWGLWYTGTSTRIDRVLDDSHTHGRVLLLTPDKTNEALLRATKESKAQVEEVISDIVYTAEHALRGGHKIHFYSEYVGYSMTIYDMTPTRGASGLIPNSDNAWVVVKPLEPEVGAGAREINRVYRNKDRIKFNGYLNQYKELWKRSNEVISKDGMVTCQKQQWKVVTICKITSANTANLGTNQD